MGRLAIIAGGGALPASLAAAQPGALFVTLQGVESAPPRGAEVLAASYERFGELFDGLRAAAVTEVVLAGHMARPALNPANFDAKMRALAPGFLAAMQGGDDQLLRAVIRAFEEAGFAVRGAHELVDGLTAAPGLLAGPPPDETAQADIARAAELLAALGPFDVGQGAVMARGVCLGIETVQGTDALLRFAATAKPHLRTGGVFVKAPKPGQDLRVDMPAVGPATVEAAAAAGLAGVAIAAGRVLVLERARMLDAAEAAGLFVLAGDIG